MAKMKITPRSLDMPMSEHDFQQLTLTANLLAICHRLAQRETNRERRAAYAVLHRDAKRIESSIKGYLDPSVAEISSSKFYMDMETAVCRFLRSFQDAKPVGRDSKGRFTRI